MQITSVDAAWQHPHDYRLTNRGDRISYPTESGRIKVTVSIEDIDDPEAAMRAAAEIGRRYRDELREARLRAEIPTNDEAARAAEPDAYLYRAGLIAAIRQRIDDPAALNGLEFINDATASGAIGFARIGSGPSDACVMATPNWADGQAGTIPIDVLDCRNGVSFFTASLPAWWTGDDVADACQYIRIVVPTVATLLLLHYDRDRRPRQR